MTIFAQKLLKIVHFCPKMANFRQKWPFFVKIQDFEIFAFLFFSWSISHQKSIIICPFDRKFRVDYESDLLFPGNPVKGRQQVELLK